MLLKKIWVLAHCASYKTTEYKAIVMATIMLFCCKKGWCRQKWLKVWTALKHKSNEEIIKKINKLMIKCSLFLLLHNYIDKKMSLKENILMAWSRHFWNLATFSSLSLRLFLTGLLCGICESAAAVLSISSKSHIWSRSSGGLWCESVQQRNASTCAYLNTCRQSTRPRRCFFSFIYISAGGSFL